MHFPHKLFGFEVPGEVSELLLVPEDKHIIPMGCLRVIDAPQPLDRTFEVHDVHHPFPLGGIDPERTLFI